MMPARDDSDGDPAPRAGRDDGDRIDRLVRCQARLEAAVAAQGASLDAHRAEMLDNWKALRAELREDFARVHQRISDNDARHRELSAAHRGEAAALIEGHVAKDHHHFEALDGRVDALERRHVGEDAVGASLDRRRRIYRALAHTALGAALAAFGAWLVQHFGSVK